MYNSEYFSIFFIQITFMNCNISLMIKLQQILFNNIRSFLPLKLMIFTKTYVSVKNNCIIFPSFKRIYKVFFFMGIKKKKLKNLIYDDTSHIEELISFKLI